MECFWKGRNWLDSHYHLLNKDQLTAMNNIICSLRFKHPTNAHKMFTAFPTWVIAPTAQKKNAQAEHWPRITESSTLISGTFYLVLITFFVCVHICLLYLLHLAYNPWFFLFFGPKEHLWQAGPRGDALSQFLDPNILLHFLRAI